MSAPTVEWRPQARADLLALYAWIAEAAGPDIAFGDTSRIEAFVDGLASFPARGTPRDDLAPDVRTMVYRRRTVIAYRSTSHGIEILRLLHAGQQWSHPETDAADQ